MATRSSAAKEVQKVAVEAAPIQPTKKIKKTKAKKIAEKAITPPEATPSPSSKKKIRAPKKTGKLPQSPTQGAAVTGIKKTTKVSVQEKRGKKLQTTPPLPFLKKLEEHNAKLIQEAFDKICAPSNPLKKFLSPTFQNEMNSLIKTENWEDAQNRLVEEQLSINLSQELQQGLQQVARALEVAPPSQSIEDLFQAAAQKIRMPAHPLQKFLPADFQGVLNSLKTRKLVGIAQIFFLMECQNALRLQKEEQKFEAEVKEATYSNPKTPKNARELRDAKNFQGALASLQTAYVDMKEKLPGIWAEIETLKNTGQFEKALRLFEKAVATTTSKNIRTSYEKMGKEVLGHCIGKSSKKPTSGIKEFIYSIFQAVVRFVRWVFHTSAEETPLARETAGAPPKQTKKVPPLSAQEKTQLQEFLRYCQGNLDFNKRLATCRDQDEVNAFLYTFSHKTKLAKSIQGTQDKAQNICGNANMKRMSDLVEAIQKQVAVAEWRDVGADQIVRLIATLGGQAPKEILDHLDEFSYISHHNEHAVQHWKDGLHEKYLQVPNELKSSVADFVSKIEEYCDEMCSQISDDSRDKFAPPPFIGRIKTKVKHLDGAKAVLNLFDEFQFLNHESADALLRWQKKVHTAYNTFIQNYKLPAQIQLRHGLGDPLAPLKKSMENFDEECQKICTAVEDFQDQCKYPAFMLHAAKALRGAGDDKEKQAIIALFDEFQFVNAFNKNDLQRWQKQVEETFLKTHPKPPEELQEAINEINKACDDMCHDNDTIQENFKAFKLEAKDKLSSREMFNLHTVERLQEVLPDVELPIIHDLKTQTEAISQDLSKFDNLIQACSVLEAGDISIHEEERLREYHGKKRHPSFQELRDPETFYFSVLGKMRHAALIGVQRSGPRTVEVTNDGYQDTPLRFEDSIYSNTYTLNFANILEPAHKDALKAKLGIENEDEFNSTIKRLYQKKMNALVAQHRHKLNRILLEENAGHTLFCAMANHLDSLFWGKLIARHPFEHTAEEQINSLAEKLKCSVFVSHLMKITFAALEEELNGIAGTERVSYLQDVLPPLTEGITPANLKEFADKYCTPVPQNTFTAKCMLSGEEEAAAAPKKNNSKAKAA